MNAESSARDSEVPPIVSASDRGPFAAGLVPRPPLGLSPRARSRSRAPPPSRATLNCARFSGSCGDSGTQKVFSSRQQRSPFSSTCFSPGDNLFRAPAAAAAAAAISACRRASISLPSLGLADATDFLLSITSLSGSPSPFLVGIRIRYYSASSSSICTAQNST